MSTTTTPSHATWMAHGQPAAFTYFGRKGSGPAAEGTEVASVSRERNTLTLLAADGSTIEQIGVTAKVWLAASTDQDSPAADQPPAADQDEVKTYLAGQPVRATWKGHGNPQAFTYCGAATAGPSQDRAAVVKVTKAGSVLALLLEDETQVASLGAAGKFWAIVPEGSKTTTTKAKGTPRQVAKPTGARAERIAELQPKAPAGYAVLWPHASHSLLKATDQAPEGSSPWLVLCNEHGTTTKAGSAREGETLGAKAKRQTWCKKCQTAAAKAEAAKAGQTPADEAK